MSWMKKHSVVLGCTILAAVLSLLYLGRESIWVDEVYSIRSALKFTSLVSLIVKDEGRMVLYYVLLRGWLNFGSDEFTIRLLSVLFSVASVPVLYATVRRLFHQRVANYAAFLIALNPFVVRYAQEARSYSLFMFFAILSTYFFVRWVQKPSTGNIAGWVIASVLGIYSHLFQVWMIAAQGVSLLFLPWKSIRWFGILMGSLAIGVMFLPILLWSFDNGVTGVTWILKPDAFIIYDAFRQFSGSLPALALIVVPTVSLAFLSWYKEMKTDWRGEKIWSYALPVLWVLVPVVSTLIVSSVKQPIFVARYLICVVPGLIILAAIGFERLRSPWHWVLLAGLVVTSGRTIGKMYLETENEEWREVTSHVLSLAQPGDAALFYAYFVHLPFDYYRARAGGDSLLPRDVEFMTEHARQGGLSDMPPPNLAVLDSLHYSSPRVWLILAHDFDYLGRGLDRELIQRTLLASYNLAADTAYHGVKLQLYVRRDVAAHE
jgi:mannosyltransferase